MKSVSKYWFYGASFTLTLVLAGCSILGNAPTAAYTIYAPNIRVAADPAWPEVEWQLSLNKPFAARMIDSARIVVRPAPGELQIYKGAVWSQPPTDMLETTVLRAFEDSNKIRAVGRLNTGIRANYRLLMEIRRFDSDYVDSQQPAATVEVTAKLLDHTDQNIIASKTFLRVEPAADASIPSVVAAFERALGTLSGDIVGWTLRNGQADYTGRPAASARRH